MKKKICFLLTLVISLFVFSGRVEAAKELTCIYEDTALISPEHYMLVQNSAGELFAYYNHAGDLSMNDPNWVNRVDYGNIVKFDFTETNKDNDGVLSGCPKYSQGYKFKWNGDLNTHVYTFYFSDDKHYFKDDHEGTQYDYLPELDVYISFYMDKKAEYQKSIDEMINSGDYKMCKYVHASSESQKVSLYFNSDKFFLIDDAGTFDILSARFNMKELLMNSEAMTYTSGCPENLYEEIKSQGHEAYYYLNADKYGIYELIDTGGNTVVAPPADIIIDSCKILLGDDLLKQINQILNIVKIAIPVLLIGFGIIDFTKVIFAGSEEDMNKGKKKFFNRLLAAILVFVAPIFINLILSLANEVWSNISADTCIGQDG